MLQLNRMGRSALVACIAVVLVGPVSCSSTTSGERTPTDEGSTRIVIDGQTRMIEGKVGCGVGPTGEVSIEVDALDAQAPGAGPPDPAVVLDLTPRGDTPSVSLLAINLPDIRLSAGRYRPSGSPTAKKAGNTYTVTGEAAVVGPPADRPVYKPFELELTCP